VGEAAAVSIYGEKGGIAAAGTASISPRAHPAHHVCRPPARGQPVFRRLCWVGTAENILITREQRQPSAPDYRGARPHQPESAV